MLALLCILFMITGIIMLTIGVINVIGIITVGRMLHDDSDEIIELARKADRMSLTALLGSLSFFIAFIFYALSVGK